MDEDVKNLLASFPNGLAIKVPQCCNLAGASPQDPYLVEGEFCILCIEDENQIALTHMPLDATYFQELLKKLEIPTLVILQELCG